MLDYLVQSRSRKVVKEVSYAQLRSGTIDINGKKVRTSSIFVLPQASRYLPGAEEMDAGR
jgi:uncharacterized protein (DUF39 family)